MPALCLTRLRVSLTVATMLGSSSCLPIPITRTLAPAVWGSYHSKDGRALVGAHVALSTDPTDSSCARATRATVTDSAGTFSVPAAKRRESFVLLLPIDRAAPYYRMCLSVAGRVRPIVQTWSLHPSRPDSLRCIVSAESVTAPVTCGGWLEADTVSRRWEI